ITGGRPVATAAQPGLTVHMLESLRAGEGHKVLEIGTGMGYSTALLCELVGSHLVTTVEVDPNVAGRAEQALHRAGYEPTILVRDGLTRHAEGAPYARRRAKFPGPRSGPGPGRAARRAPGDVPGPAPPVPGAGAGPAWGGPRGRPLGVARRSRAHPHHPHRPGPGRG